VALPSQNNTVSVGQRKPSTTWGEYNNIAFTIMQMMAKMQTATLVQIVSCTNSGGIDEPVGFVDVLPLVNQIDGLGNATPHTTIFNLPYFRMQGGKNAVIIDPEIGDIGICVFANRDISKIKSTKKQGNPDSYRQFSFSDGLYIGGVLNAIPEQYVQFNSTGINIVSKGVLDLTAESVSITADNFNVASTTFTHNGVNIGANHHHSGVQTGTGNTGGPS
jgi:hypothetical protein